MRVQFRTVWLLLAATGCVSAMGGPARAPRDARLLYPPASEAVPIEVPGSYLGLRRGHREVVRSSRRWRQLTAPWQGRGPSIDFDRELVVVAALGRRHATGPYILVDGVMAHGSTLYVVVHSHDCHGPYFGGMMVVEPVAMVRAPRRYRAVRFIERESRIPDCLG